MSHFLDSHAVNKKRYVDASSKLVDPLLKGYHGSHSNVIYPKKLRINAQGTTDLNSVVTFELPRTGYLADMFVEADYEQTSGDDYVPYIACAAISRVRIFAGSEILHDYDYVDVMSYCLSQMKDSDAANRLMVASGGSAVNSSAAAFPNLQALIPTAWSSLLGMEPLVLHKINVRVKIEVTYRADTDVIIGSGTSGGISNGKLICYLYESDTPLRNKHKQMGLTQKSIDFKTFKSSAVSTGTETDLDISSITGNIKFLSVRSSLSSEIDTTTPVDFFNHQVIDTIKTVIDSNEEIQFLTDHEGQVDSLFYNDWRSQGTEFSYVYMVPYHYSMDNKQSLKHFTGGMHSSAVNKNILRVTHSCGADCEFGVTGIVDALFVYENGGLSKYL